MSHVLSLKILGVFLSIIFITSCATTPDPSKLMPSTQISQHTRDAIAICSGNYGSSNSAKLEAKFLKSGANAELALKQLEGGGPMYIEGLGDAATVDLYREYVKCIGDNQSQQVQPHANNINASKTKTSQQITKSLHGIEYALQSCNREGGNNLVCDFVITSKFRDRTLDFIFSKHDEGSKIFDNFGAKFIANKIISNSIENTHAGYRISLIADVPVKVLVKFSNISTRSSEIKKLELSVQTYLNRKSDLGKVEYRNIPI